MDHDIRREDKNEETAFMKVGNDCGLMNVFAHLYPSE